ncbi:30S ribosomal protein S1 [Symmachiella dynata]|uniref:30S ribosomal protein S1 n=1 Tax=Symmachiella dynata TaxID=2527995 RepID=A0A517ZLR3_9PLAN|nr:S1 RNA-binding domain-containing protein [Symmachiella dynata]QDU43375.1 30S ribosomal protein S1 [Symmachiella dynata]
MNSEQSTSSHNPITNQTPVDEPAEAGVEQTPADSEESSLSTAPPETGRTEPETPAVAAGSPEETKPAAEATEAASSTPEPPAETAAPETKAEATETPVAASTGDATSAEPAARPRVKLNPTVDPSMAVAIPSPSLADSRPSKPSTEAEPTGEEAAAVAEAQAVQSTPPPPATPSADPVSLPPANVDLDADVEAELAAALASEKPTEAPKVVATEGGETSEPVTEEDLEPGTKLKGRVQSIQKDSILLDVGFRSSAMIQLRQFEGRKQPQLGQELEIVIDRFDAADGLLLASLPRMARSAGNWDEVSVGQIVDCLVKKSNKGGLEVTVSNLRGFMPASQVDLGFVESLDEYVGQKLTVKIIEVKPEKRNLVVSRRAYMQAEREEVAQDLWKTLEAGQTHSGTVKTVKDYGAFVDIGGIDGLLHVAEMSWTRVNHPRDILKVGQQLEVQLISVDAEKKKISLSLKQLKKNPWDDCVQRYPVESIVQGKVTNITNFGAFIEIEEGVEGLIHISEIDYRRINKVSDVLKEGQEVEAKVVSIDGERKRIGLSMKALKAKPEPVKKPKDEDLSPSGGEAYQRKRKGPLKGGTGGSSGPLFG